MPDQAVVEITEGTDVTRFESPDGDDLVDVRVALGEGKKASTAQVTLADPLLNFVGTLPVPTKHSRILCEIWMGTGPLPAKVFSGFVTSYDASGSGDNANQTVIEVTDKMKGARRKKKARIRRASSAEQFAKTIVEEQGLQLDLTRANLSDVEFSRVLQHGENAWTTLVRMMESAGHKAKVRGDTVFIEEVGATRTNDPVVLTYGDNVKTFDFNLVERTGKRSPNVFDFDGEQVFEDEDVESEDRPVRIQRAGLALSTDDFPSFSKQAVLKSKQAQARAKKVFTATIVAEGLLTEFDTDDVAILQRFGDRLSGVWNIEAIQLSFADRTTTFNLFNGGRD